MFYKMGMHNLKIWLQAPMIWGIQIIHLNIIKTNCGTWNCTPAPIQVSSFSNVFESNVPVKKIFIKKKKIVYFFWEI